MLQVFVTPRGEPFPNMLAETGFVAHIGSETTPQCPQFAAFGADPAVVSSEAFMYGGVGLAGWWLSLCRGLCVDEQKPNVDYVRLVNVPAEVAPGQTFNVRRPPHTHQQH